MSKFDINKHIVFELIEKKPKTDVISVTNTFDNCLIGIIRWDNGWRHYVFIPENDTKFSDRCMIKIGEYVRQLNEVHGKYW